MYVLSPYSTSPIQGMPDTSEKYVLIEELRAAGASDDTRHHQICAATCTFYHTSPSTKFCDPDLS